jgi:hypothetical protein
MNWDETLSRSRFFSLANLVLAPVEETHENLLSRCLQRGQRLCRLSNEQFSSWPHFLQRATASLAFGETGVAALLALKPSVSNLLQSPVNLRPPLLALLSSASNGLFGLRRNGVSSSLSFETLNSQFLAISCQSATSTQTTASCSATSSLVLTTVRLIRGFLTNILQVFAL